jgi:hypothetical protein
VTATVTQNTIPVTRQAQEAFNETVTALNKVEAQVLHAVSDLTNGGMVSVSASVFTAALEQWTLGFNDIVRTCRWMANQLGQTADQIQRNEDNNVDLASGLTAAAQPLAPRMALAMSTETFAPGQAVRMGIRSEGPLL